MKLDPTNWPTWKDEKPELDTIILLYQIDRNGMHPKFLYVQDDGTLVYMDADVDFIPDDNDKWIEL